MPEDVRVEIEQSCSSSDDGSPKPLSRRLELLSSIQSECCIFRIHKHLREVKKEAYKPEIIAIGPYHCNKENVLMMEEHKLRYLNSVLLLKNEAVETYLSAIRPLDQEVRNFYAEPLSLAREALAEMMVLDGCFIIQLVRILNGRCFRDQQNDPIFKFDWIRNSLWRDLLLFENQIPFFILSKLFAMIEMPNEQRLINLVLNFLPAILPGHSLDRRPREGCSHGKINHLLDLIHKHWEPSRGTPSSPRGDSTSKDVNSDEDGYTMPCAMELREAGVKFAKKQTENLFDISFENGTLQIPAFRAEDATDSILRNLIAYEQYCGTSRRAYVTDYAAILDCLIDSSKDVELLRRYGIIQNLLGDSEVVAQLFNRIGDSVALPCDSRYTWIFQNVNSYRNKRRNRWMAKLRRNHFNSPWGVISILAASLLLLFTLTQTIFTVFPRN